ncbi:hypothetical protein F2Q68_00029476 [Brassica cretica]|uniref:Uncharacterized protein n=1 Tax=Brassica cretica TaxID=69181 RepID=A0A8S9GD74_BRACR|nr:hypothetical protein F2Q68_00029476 [Brassica cretica]
MVVRIRNDPEVSIKISKDLRKADVDNHRWSGTGHAKEPWSARIKQSSQDWTETGKLVSTVGESSVLAKVCVQTPRDCSENKVLWTAEFEDKFIPGGKTCSIPIPRSELDQSKDGLIRRDRHVGHLSSGTTKAVKEQLELLGVTGETVKDGYRLIRNCPRAVIDGFGAQKQLWDGLTGRQAVEELNGGLGASVGGSERTLERGCVLDALAYAIAHGNTSMCLDVMVMLSDRAVNGSKERCTDVHGSRERVTGTRWFEGRMAVRCTDGIEGCRAEYVLTGQGVIVLVGSWAAERVRTD